MTVAVSAQAGGIIAPGEDLSIELTWRSAGDAPVQTVIHIDTSGDPVDVPVTANEQTCALAARDPGPFSFGVTAAGATHTAAVPIRNAGLRACTITARIGGSGAAEVQLVSAPMTLAPNAIGYVELRYTPQTSTLNARLIVDAREDGATLRVDLEGSLRTPSLYLRRYEAQWGRVPAGCAEGAERVIDLVNVTGNAIAVGAVQIEPPSSDFIAPAVRIATLGPGERHRLRVRAQPAQPGVTRARLRVQAGGDVQYVELSAQGVQGLVPVTAAVSPAPVGAIDVLFVLDGDLGSTRVATGMGDAARDFMASLGAGDHHIGVLQVLARAGTDRGNLVGQPAVLTPASPNAGMSLGARMTFTGLTITSTPLLQAAAEAVEARRTTNANAGFLRPEGQLEIVVVTTRDDASNATIGALLGLLSDRTIGRLHAVRVSAVSGGANGCGRDGTVAGPAPRLERAVAATGGLSLSACPQGGSQVANMTQLAALFSTPPRAGLELASEATPGTITVTSGNGVALFGASYDREHVAVVFDGLAQPSNSGVQITWTPWCVGPSCGDGHLDPLEQCDFGAGSGAIGCHSSTCHVAVCGDGETQSTERCDDGNLDDDDGCTRLCFPSTN
jgi:cysteine-rich repeat protein